MNITTRSEVNYIDSMLDKMEIYADEYITDLMLELDNFSVIGEKYSYIAENMMINRVMLCFAKERAHRRYENNRK